MSYLKTLFARPRVKSIRKKMKEADAKRKKLSRDFARIKKEEARKLKKVLAKKKPVKKKVKKGKKTAWNIFVSKRMSRYMKKYGSHTKAMRKISTEWKAKKK